MIKIYNIYRNGNNANDCMPPLTAFVGCNLESLKEIVPKKIPPTLFDLTEHKRSENYMLIYSPRIKYYCLDTIENFMEKSYCIKWIHIGNIK